MSVQKDDVILKVIIEIGCSSEAWRALIKMTALRQFRKLLGWLNSHQRQPLQLTDIVS